MDDTAPWRDMARATFSASRTVGSSIRASSSLVRNTLYDGRTTLLFAYDKHLRTSEDR